MHAHCTKTNNTEAYKENINNPPIPLPPSPTALRSLILTICVYSSARLSELTETLAHEMFFFPLLCIQMGA